MYKNSSNQLLRQIKSSSKYFATLDWSTGYHQIGIDDSSSNLLVIATPSGRYRMVVLAQGVLSASNIFSLLTDGRTRMHNSIKWSCAWQLYAHMLVRASWACSWRFHEHSNNLVQSELDLSQTVFWRGILAIFGYIFKVFPWSYQNSNISVHE